MKDEIAGTIYAKDYTEWMVKTGGYARDVTMRDHFAAKAMQELIHEVFDPEKIAGCAYEQADAMLKERAK
jgi:hypothetical protein